MGPIFTPQIRQQIGDAANNQAALASLPAPPIAQMDMGSALPSLSVPQINARPQNQIERDTDRLNALRNSPAGVSQIHNPFLRGLARTADVVGSVFAPGLSVAIPGTTLHHNYLVNQAQANLANDQANQKAAADIENVESQSNERDTLAKKADALAAADTPMPITAELAEAAGAPQLEGISMTPKDYQKLVANHQTVQGRIQTNANTNNTRQSISDDKIQATADQGQANRESRESLAGAANKTRMLIAQMHDATSRANNANTNDHKGMSGEGSYKVPADVTKRAALANNVTENADAVDDLLKKRPDIVGAAGGRYTSVQQMIGSDDPAIAELGVRMHNIALASNGAHGVRAQQAIAQTEEELFNHFKTGPTGIHSALNATRASMQTFLNDEANYQNSGKRTGSDSKDPLGIR